MSAPVPPLLAAARFLVSAHERDQWPADEGAEVAFAGRSNVGKSSAVNAILGRRALARTSKTPGRTRQIVFFAVGERLRLVDLPGYGYARVPADLKRHWQDLVERYLAGRRSLRGLFLPMDIRHPLTELDRTMIGWAQRHRLPVHVLLTKADKLGRGRRAQALAEVARALGDSADLTVQCFSAVDGTGVEQARMRLLEWLAPAMTSGPVVEAANSNRKNSVDLTRGHKKGPGKQGRT